MFFLIGEKAAAHPEIVAAEVANGEVIGNHTWNHPSLTGKATGTRPLSQAQVRDQLARANAAIVTVGAPEPSLWRPPYGGVNAADVATARALGLCVVLDSGTNIIDSNDWDGLSAQQIVARVDPRLRDGTIIAFHDGLKTAAPTTIGALPLIVAHMNAHHLGATTAVRPDATGGVVPYPGRARRAGRTRRAAPLCRSAAAAARRTAACGQQAPRRRRAGSPAPRRVRTAPGTHRPRAQHAPACPAAQHDHACARTVHDEPSAEPDREHACAGHDQPRACAHGRPLMAPPATRHRLVGAGAGSGRAGRSAGAGLDRVIPGADAAPSRDPVGRSRFLAGYAAGIEDGLEVSRAA